MNGFNEEVFIPEKIRSGANIPVKVSEVDLKAAESIKEMQPVYYNSTSKEFTIKSENGELYGFSAVTSEVSEENTSKTQIPVYLSGEFYKSSVKDVLAHEEDVNALTILARKLGIFLE